MKIQNWSKEGEEFRQKLLQDLKNNKGKELDFLNYMRMNAKTEEEKQIIRLCRKTLIADV